MNTYRHDFCGPGASPESPCSGWATPPAQPGPHHEAPPHPTGTHIQGLEAVPAEGVFAVLAHHLGTAFVPLDVDFALGAALDGRVILVQLESGAKAGKTLSGCAWRLRGDLPAGAAPQSRAQLKGLRLCVCSVVSDCPGTAARHAPLSKRLPKQEYCSGLL